jgi:hypothetical protein
MKLDDLTRLDASKLTDETAVELSMALSWCPSSDLVLGHQSDTVSDRAYQLYDEDFEHQFILFRSCLSM